MKNLSYPEKLPNIVTVENIKHERFLRNPRIARTLTEFGWGREMNEGVKRIYSEMESAFLHEPKYSEPGNKVVLTLENSITSRTLRRRDSLEIKVEDYSKLSIDEKLLLQYMYNTGEQMTTKKLQNYWGVAYHIMASSQFFSARKTRKPPAKLVANKASSFHLFFLV